MKNDPIEENAAAGPGDQDAHVVGKKQVFYPYIGGAGAYREVHRDRDKGYAFS